VDPLGAALPLPGEYGHAYRLHRQEQARWLYLVAADPSPIGACLVHWAGPVSEQVRRALPEAVEISSLQVAAAARGRGAGRMLIAEAERQAALRGRTTIGVAVDDENLAARRLYERLGYTASGTRFTVEYDYLDDAGVGRRAVEQGAFLIKRLDRP
jgi:ribosomal protein S18 acetylase RimI-like enzyme